MGDVQRGRDRRGVAAGEDLAVVVDAVRLAAGSATRAVPLGDRTVLRTPSRPDHRPGQALVLHTPTSESALHDAVREARARLGPSARVVAPVAAADLGPLLDVVVASGASAAPATVLTHPDPSAWASTVAVPGDVALAAPGDERAWHGLTVLQRHVDAAPERGQDDERHRWWVRELADLVGAGRARVLRAARHGTPVGSGALLWDPRVDVGPRHAGLAVVADVVVHPAHRRLGIGRAIVGALADAHLRDFPRARVVATVPTAVAGPTADPAADPPTDPPTGPAVDPPTDPPTGPAVGPATDPATEQGWVALAHLLVVDLRPGRGTDASTHDGGRGSRSR